MEIPEGELAINIVEEYLSTTVNTNQSDIYLQRLGLDPDQVKAQSPSLELLHEICRAHTLSIPWECLDVHLQQRIRLDLNAFYEKIVNRRRGGFCYEVSMMTAWLLRSIGFSSVGLCSASVCTGRNPEGIDTFRDISSHLCVVVSISGSNYLVDLGFTEGPTMPLLMDCVEQIDPLDGYLHRFVPSHDNRRILQRKSVGLVGCGVLNPAGTWESRIRLQDKPPTIAEVQKGIDFVQDSPEIFMNRSCPNHRILCAFATTTTRITLLSKTHIRVPHPKFLPASPSEEDHSNSAQAAASIDKDDKPTVMEVWERRKTVGKEREGVVKRVLADEQEYLGVLKQEMGIVLGDEEQAALCLDVAVTARSNQCMPQAQ